MPSRRKLETICDRTEDTPIFNAKEHTYTDSVENFQYCSVTRWIEQFKPEFNEQDMAKRVARNEGVPVELVLEEWERKRNNSTKFGTRVHKALEVFCSEGKILYPEYKNILTSFKNLGIALDKKNCDFEKLVFNKKYRIAGTSDVIIRNTDKKTFSIYDFKTNKKFRYISRFGQKMLGPLEKFPCAEYYAYAMQLSMYAYLYKEMSGLEPLRLKVFWYERFEPEDYSKTEGRWHIINLPYLEEEIINCLEYDSDEE